VGVNTSLRSPNESSSKESTVSPTSTIMAVLGSTSVSGVHSPETVDGSASEGRGCDLSLTPTSHEGGQTPRTTRRDSMSDGIPKPWTRKLAHMRVVNPPRGTPHRMARLKRANEVMSQFLGNTPYVEFAWTDSRERSLALLDSGADWSLINEAGMTKEERDMISPTNLEGKGVGGEAVPLVGEIWRSVEIGGLLVPDQRFVVVRDMITNVILGADFWGRVSPITFDFAASSLKLGESGVEIPLYYDDRGNSSDKGDRVINVVLGETQVIPPMTEALVEGKVKGMCSNTTYLLEPKRAEDSQIQAPFTVVRAREDGNTIVAKVANLSQSNVTLYKGQILGTLTSNVSVLKGKLSQYQGTGRSDDVKDWKKDLVVGEELSGSQKQQLLGTLDKFNSVFYKGGPLPVVTVGVEHSVRLKEDAVPVACRPRRLSQEEEREVRKEIDTLFEQGLIRRSNSPWASPVVCARRADGSLRLALDYRLVNAVSYPATLHPIPLIEDLLDRLAEAKFFSVLDAKSGYHQMPLTARDSEVTAFVTPWDHLEWTERTPFGLKGAGYSFQRMMAVILGDSNFTEALCYLDDILIWGTTWGEHMARLNSVLAKVQMSGLALSIKKCRFGVQEVQYLGSVIKQGMVSISEQRVQDLRALPTPTTVRELRRVLGAFSFVQRWLPGVAEVMKPLHSGVAGKPHSKIVWTVEMNQAFNKLKKLVANASALKIPDDRCDFTLITDCSDVGAGAVLTQVEEPGGLLVPVAYFHHTLSKAEQKYGVTDKEMLAVVLAMKRFRVYLSRKFTLVTDHSALRWLKSLDINDEKGRRGRWMDFISQFDMDVVHRPGKSPELSMADYLSRIVAEGVGKPQEEQDAVQEAYSFCAIKPMEQECFGVDEIKEAQSKCPVISGLLKLFQDDGERELDEEVTDVIEANALERLFVDSRGLLMVEYSGGRRTKEHRFGVKCKNRIIIPKNFVHNVLTVVHSGALGGHMGQDRTWKRARDSFYWKNMKQDVVNYVAACEKCGRNKHSTHPNVAPFQETDLPDVPLDHLQIDFAGPFSAAQSHPYRYVLQIQDVLSRFVRMVPCISNTAEVAIECLMTQWVCIFGVPATMNSDRGTHFTSTVFEGICKAIGIKHKLGAPKHPESQGLVERQNQLIAQVRCVCENNKENWPESVHRVAFAHNIAANSTTGIAPLVLMTGQKVRDPEGIWLRDKAKGKPENKPDATYYEKLLGEKERSLMLEIERARSTTKAAQLARMKKQRVRGKAYMMGDLVRMKTDSNEVLKRGKKLAYKYSGKYEVVEVLRGGWTYRLKPLGWKGGVKIRHFNDLKDVLRLNRDTDVDSSDDESLVTGSTKPVVQSGTLGKESISVKTDLKKDSPKGVKRGAHKSVKKEVSPQLELRRSSRQRSNPKRLVISDMKAKKYDEVQESVTEVSSEDEVESSHSSYKSFHSVNSEEVESIGEDSPVGY
jgi:hypothetical protein